MNNKYSIEDIDIKCELKDCETYATQNKIDMVQSQQIKLEKTCDTDDYMNTKYNMIHHTIEIKEEYSNLYAENSFKQDLNADQQNVKTIEFVNVKVEHQDDFDTEESLLDNITDPIAFKDGYFKCGNCKQAFSTVACYHEHTTRCRSRVHHQASTSSDNVSVANAEDKKPRLSEDQEGFYRCDQCDNTYKSRDAFKLHARRHSGVGLYTCSECNKQFPGRTDFARHILIHTKEKPYKCTQCEAMFTRTATLKQHMLTHSGARPHKCTQCGKSFTYSGVLIRHMRTHTGERPYHCAQCPKTFIKSDDLRIHVRAHTGERPYQCTVCDKAFTRKKNVKRHIETHFNKSNNQP